MQFKFTKNDALSASFIGFYVALLFLAILENFDTVHPLVLSISQSPMRWGLVIAIPILALALLYITYRLSVMAGTRSWFQIGKFLTTGFGNLLVDLGLANILITLTGYTDGLEFSVIKGATFVVAVFHSYFWNKFWTFHKTGSQQLGKEFFSFFIVAVIGFGVNVGVASFVVNVIPAFGGFGPAVWANVAIFAASIASFVWNFLGSKFFVFERRTNALPVEESKHFE